MDKKQRDDRRHQEDRALTRALLWVAAAVILEALLVFLNRFYINYYVDEIEFVVLLQGVLRAVRIGGLVLAVVAFVWSVLQARKGGKAVLPLLICLGAGALAVCSHVVLKYKDTGVSMLFWLVVAWAALAVVYYLYQKEFFLGLTAAGLSVLGLWFVRFGQGPGYEAALLLAGILLVLAATLWLKKAGGALPFPKESPIQFLPADCSYTMTLSSCLGSLLVLAAAMALGATVAYYLIFVMLAWIFALFMYYTVKMM